MKSIARFLLVLSCVAPFCAANAVVSQTAGSNLTAYNGESGSTNNNRWNNLTNARSISAAGSNATADFGNCNAVIMRCAQPKCGNGGCTDMSVTSGIVSGCVQSNASCKQYGDELVEYIAAQLVAQSTAKANAAANAAQTAAANAASAQTAQQMQQMQQQMQQMQSQMAAQNAEQMAQLQSALEQQKQLTANAIAEATATREATPVQTVQAVSSTNNLNDAQLSAAQSGVSADVLAREQISGQIMSAIENAETQLKTLKATMTDTFNYAGCDSRGNNCTGPKRVKTFKQKAEGFFDPYENVLDELYDALILAQSVGVDITDIYMMLNGTCNAWAQYLCADDQVMHYTASNCKNGRSIEEYEGGEKPLKALNRKTGLRGGHACVVGQVVPMSDGGCQLIKMLADKEEVQRNWLYPEQGEDSRVRVGCASEALDNSALFRNRKKQAAIDIETLEKIIAQDAPAISRNKNDLGKEFVKYCAITEPMYANLQRLVTTKTLPTKDICIDERKLNQNMNNVFISDDASMIEMARKTCSESTGAVFSNVLYRCFCEKSADGKGCDEAESENKKIEAENKQCIVYGGSWGAGCCNCGNITDDEDRDACSAKFESCAHGGTSKQSVVKSEYKPNTTNSQYKFELTDPFWSMGKK